MLEQFLSYTSSSVLRLLELEDPAVNRGVELRESFFLLEDGFEREARYAGRAQVAADPVVQVATAKAEGAVGCAEVFAAFV